MEPVQLQATPHPQPSTGLFGTKIPATVAFLVAILLFFLPFAEVRCNGTPLAHNSGIGIATGSDWSQVKTKGLFGNEFANNSNDADTKAQKQDPNVFAIAALALGIIGFLMALLASRRAGSVNLIVGLLAAAALIAMLFDLKSKAKSDNSIKSSDLGLNAGVNVTVDGTTAFYFAVILFLLGAVLSWQRSRTRTG